MNDAITSLLSAGDAESKLIAFITAAAPFVKTYTPYTSTNPLKLCLQQTSSNDQSKIEYLHKSISASQFKQAADILQTLNTANTYYNLFSQVPAYKAIPNLVLLQKLNHKCAASCLNSNNPQAKTEVYNDYLFVSLDTVSEVFTDVTTMYRESGQLGYTLPLNAACTHCLFQTFGGNMPVFMDMLTIQLAINEKNYQQASSIAIGMVNVQVVAAPISGKQTRSDDEAKVPREIQEL